MPLPFSVIGYLLEPLYLRLPSSNVLTSRRSGHPCAITVSESSKRDLMHHGFKEHNISIIISEGMILSPASDLESAKKYEQQPTILFLGTSRAMKRTHHVSELITLSKRLRS